MNITERLWETRRATLAVLVAAGTLLAGLPLATLPAAAGAELSAQSGAGLNADFLDPMAMLESASAILPLPEREAGGAAGGAVDGLIEIVERRTERSKTFLTEVPGRFVTKVFSGPVHYQVAASGDWLPIDQSLVSIGAGLVGVTANRFSLEFALDQTAGELARFVVDGEHSVAFGLDGAHPGVGLPGADSVTYHRVLPDVDLKLHSKPGGLKEDIILHTRSVPDTFVFPLLLQGLTAEMDSVTGDVVYRDIDGVEQARTPRGFMEDSNVDPRSGEAASSEAVTYELVPHQGGMALRVRIDRDWINAPERAFPIIVDPSFFTLPDDTYVMSGFTRDNSWDGELKVGTYDGGVHVGKAYMHFDVSGLYGKTIDSSTFYVRNHHSWSCEQRGLGVYRVNQGWDGRTMRDYPGAALGARIAWAPFAMGYEPGGCGDGWAYWDIQPTVQAWANEHSDFGLAMTVDPGSESDNYAWKKFTSWDGAGGGELTPHIDITWSEPNAAPSVPDSRAPAHGWVGSAAPQLSAQYYDPGDSGYLDFEVSGQPVKRVAASHGQTASWAPSLGTGTYSWRVRAYDGALYSAWSGWWSFTVDTSAPAAPSVSSSSHPNQGSWYPDNTPSFSWSGSDTSGIAGYSHILDQTSDTTPDTTSEGTATSWTAPAKGNGSWWFHVRAKNKAGLWGGAAHYRVNLDTSAPAGPSVSSSSHPSPSGWYADTTPSFAWSASDTSGISGYSRSTSLDVSSTTTPDTTSEGTGTSWTSPAVGDGSWWFHLRAKNGAGTWGTTSHFGVQVDSSAPEVTVASPSHPVEGTWYADNNPLFEWGSSDLSGIEGYRWAIDTDPNGGAGTAALSDATSDTYPGRPEGVSHFHVQARNGAGVWSGVATRTVRIDTRAPDRPDAVSSSSHPVGEVKNSRTVTFSWTAGADPAPGSGVAGYSYVFNRLATDEADETVDTTSTSPPPHTLDDDGIWYLHVKTIDGAGNASADRVYGPIHVDEDAPTLTKTVDRTDVGHGDLVTYTLRLDNTQPFPVTVNSVADDLDAGLVGVPGLASVGGQPCTATTTPSCVVAADRFTAGNLTVGAASTLDVSFVAAALGDTRSCAAVPNWASATNVNGTTEAVAAPLSVCDGALGLEQWWSYVTEELGPQASASVNVANGNLVVTATDSAPVPARGSLSYVVRRSYNSAKRTHQALAALGVGAGGIGAGWQLNIGQSDDLAGEGIGATGLIVPRPTGIDILPVTYVDRDGTRHVFTPKGLASSAAIDVSGVATGTLAPRVVGSGAGSAYRLCVDQPYQAPAGVHLGLWRYLRVTDNGAGSCAAAAANAGVLVGFAALRPDRLRYEFAWDGRLLSMVDASGVELRYQYDNTSPTGLFPAAPTDLGRLRTVYEPRSCADPSAGTCRTIRFGYSEDPSTTCPAEGPGAARCATDPAGRTTRYLLDGASPARLVTVENPDGTRVNYTYGDCGGGPAQLCSASDPVGNVTRFAYEPVPGAPSATPARANQVTDRRGSTTVIDYHDGAFTTADQGGHRTRFSAIDSTGRVGEIAQGGTDDIYLRQHLYTWDTPASSCRQPDGTVDNNLCRLVRKALNGGATPDEDTRWTYTAEGARLSEHRANPGGDIVTTWGYHVQYAQAAGTTACLDYTTSGNGDVHPASSGPCPARPDTQTIFALSDQVEMLTPRGNAPGADRAEHLTTMARDLPPAGVSVDPNAPAGVCGEGNTGLACEVRGPSFNGSDPTVTRYTYDPFGQKLTMTTPKAVAETPAGQAPPAYRYSYYGAGDLDLSGGVSAEGWLKAVTDPLSDCRDTNGDPRGCFVAFAYDRAGNTVRTWDRNATNGLDLAAFPGTVEAPTTRYAETLYGTGPAAYSSPWRHVRSQRDPLGNTTAITVDANGNPTRIRPPRGTVAGDDTFDTVQEYDANENLITKLTPVESKLPGQPRWAYSYDGFDNQTSVTDPNGHVTASGYDPANRLTSTRWTRGPWPATADEGDVPDHCDRSSAADAPLPAERITCGRSVAYDGIDNVIATQDGNGQTTTFAFDGVGREVSRLAPRSGSPVVKLRTDTRYDPDGRVTTVCLPRHFDETGAAGCDAAAKPHAEHRTYDNAGRVATSAGYRDGDTPLVTTMAWDADGNNITVTNPNQATTTRTFDLLGRKESETVPRTSTSGNTTFWVYDPVGNVTGVTRPGGVDTGTGADGDLVVDGVTAAASTDGAAHPAGNPYLLPAGKNYRSVTVRNGGWVSVAAAPAGGGHLDLKATGTITVCSTCGITATGKGPAGGAAAQAGAGSGAGGPGGSGGGGGGGGAGHATAGSAATGTGGGAVGAAYGRSDLTDSAVTALFGSGGGGGANVFLGTGGAGGAGGGYVRLAATHIDLQGDAKVTAAGVAGTSGTGILTAGGGGGGGSGGSVWLSAPTVNLGSGAGAVSVAGGPGGASSSGKTGGAGAPGRVRVDADVITGADPLPASWVNRRVGRISAYRYDAANRLIEQVDGANSTDATKAGPVDSEGGANIRSRVAYDPDGQVVARFEPRAFVASTTEPDPRFMVRTDFDADGRPVAQWVPRFDTDPAAAAAEVVASGSAQARQCPGNATPQAVVGVPGYAAGTGVCVTRLEYDPAGNVAKLVMPTTAGETTGLNRHVVYGYTDDNLVVTVDAPSPAPGGGRVDATRTLYDGEGQPVRVTDPFGFSTVTAYTADGLVSEVTEEPNGTLTHATKLGYDHAGNRISTVDAAGQTATTAYTADGLVSESLDTGANKTSYAYDNAGNALRVFSPSANACGVNANNACVVDGDPATADRGTPTVNTYTADNLLAGTTTPVAADGSSRRRVTYSYDPGGRTIAQQVATVDAAGQVTADGGTQRMAYSTADRLLRETGRDGATITARYDPAGNRVEVVDSSGPTITATYYLDGLPRTVSDGARPALFSYDGAGNRTYRADATGTTPSANRYATSYTFNDAGLPDSATSTLTGSGSWQWEYDLAGRPERETAPNGQVTTRTWNPDGTLARHTLANATGNVADWAYTYDPLFRQTTQAFTGSSAIGGGSVVDGTFAYAYDSAGRLTTFNDGAATKPLTWDADGNRLTYGDQRFTYNADDSIATADPDGAGTDPAEAFAYAPFGGVTNDGDNCLAYDGFDRLTQIAGFTTSCAATPTVTYAYDGADRQRSRIQDGAISTYHFDGWAATATVETIGGVDTAYVVDPTGTRKAVAGQGLLGATQYLAHDGFGNIATATSAAALVECTARFDPYGTPLQPRGGDNPCSSGSTINSAFYRGGRRDETTGAYQLGTRTYDPQKGTFLTPDSYRTGPTSQNLSIGTDPLTRNTYSYVNGDPVNLHDPDGHMARALACADAGDGTMWCPRSQEGPLVRQGPDIREDNGVRTHRNPAGFVTRVEQWTKRPWWKPWSDAYTWGDITNKWRRKQGSAADKAFIAFEQQCPYAFAKCIAAASIASGESLSQAKARYKQHCGSKTMSGCDTGQVHSDPIANALIETALTAGTATLLRGGVRITLGRLAPNTATSLAHDAVRMSDDWLGPNARSITNRAGDKVFLSDDGMRRIRVDINNPAPHTSPHAHVEEFINGRWVKSGPIYPRDVPQR